MDNRPSHLCDISAPMKSTSRTKPARPKCPSSTLTRDSSFITRVRESGIGYQDDWANTNTSAYSQLSLWEPDLDVQADQLSTRPRDQRPPQRPLRLRNSLTLRQRRLKSSDCAKASPETLWHRRHITSSTSKSSPTVFRARTVSRLLAEIEH